MLLHVFWDCGAVRTHLVFLLTLDVERFVAALADCVVLEVPSLADDTELGMLVLKWTLEGC